MASEDNSPPRRSLKRRLARLTSTVLISLGVLVLAWAFVVWRWNDPFTSLYTKWEQRELQAELASIQERFKPPERLDAAGQVDDPELDTSGRVKASKARTGPATAPVDPAAEAAAARRNGKLLREETRRGGALGRIRVSRIGLDMVFVNGTDHDSLVRGPGLDPRTALPGAGALVYIAGHRTTYGAPFANIDRLRAGDLIDLEMPYGRFSYRVTSHVIVPADDLARLNSRGREEVALQACWPRFSARQRYIVYATPTKTPPSS